MRPVALVFRGQDWDVEARYQRDVIQGRAFWGRVLKASYDAVHDG